MKYIKIIEQYLGKPIIGEYQFISHGTDYDVVLYECIIYRFPKSDKIDLSFEKKILDTVRSYVSLPVPNFTIVDNTFITYPCIEGEILNDCEAIYSDEFVDTLVGFIKELHSIPVDTFDFLQSKNKTADEFKAWAESLKSDVSKRLTGKVPNETIIKLNAYIHHLYFEYESPVKRFVHSDLQGDNIIYNQKDQKIVGIIDFADSRIGGVELDFCRFAYKDGDLLERMVVAYLGYLDHAFIKRAKFLAKKTIIRQIKNDDFCNNNFELILNQLRKYEFL